VVVGDDREGVEAERSERIDIDADALAVAAGGAARTEFQRAFSTVSLSSESSEAAVKV
jgi:hypothetical protein